MEAARMNADRHFWYPHIKHDPRAPRRKIPGRAGVVYCPLPSEYGADILRIVYETPEPFARFARRHDAAEKQRRRLERRARRARS
jgi:hypothetical protein